MTDNELRGLVLKNRDYFEKAIKKSLWHDVAYDYKKTGSLLWAGLTDWGWWIQTAGVVLLMAATPIILAVSPIWFPLKSWAIRRKVSAILKEPKP